MIPFLLQLFTDIRSGMQSDTGSAYSTFLLPPVYGGSSGPDGDLKLLMDETLDVMDSALFDAAVTLNVTAALNGVVQRCTDVLMVL